MEIDDDALALLKTAADTRMRAIIDSAVAKTNLARNLCYFVAALALGMIYVTGWVIRNDYAIESLRAVQKENRDYIRDLWQPVFKQPLPPPPGK